MNLSKHFGKVKVLDDISFSVEQGAILGITGPNSSGKSTLLKILAGFTRPSSGSVYVDEKKTRNRSVEQKHLFGYSHQDDGFYPELTVRENLDYFGKLFWLTKEQLNAKRDELLTITGLSEFENTQAKHLSGGVRRRLDVACALIHSPRILILDEPTEEIDIISAEHLWSLLDTINKQGTTIVISTHDLNNIETLCSSLLIIDKGRVIAHGTPQELKQKHTKFEIIKLETKPQKYDAIIQEINEDHLPIGTIEKKNKSLYIQTTNPELVIIKLVVHAIENKKDIIDLDINSPTIQDVYEAILKKQ